MGNIVLVALRLLSQLFLVSSLPVEQTELVNPQDQHRREKKLEKLETHNIPRKFFLI